VGQFYIAVDNFSKSLKTVVLKSLCSSITVLISISCVANKYLSESDVTPLRLKVLRR